jgi:hypothetical protein
MLGGYGVADFNGVRQKLKRAQVHLEALNDTLDVGGGPYGLAIDPDPEPGYYLVKTQLRRSLDGLPPLVGDLLYNLRSALDHMVWQLVLANGGTPDRKRQMPIGFSEAWFNSKAKVQLAGVHDDATTAIRTFQPFRVSDEGQRKVDPLWLLSELENVDKHRLLHVVALAPADAYLRFDPRFPLVLGESIELFDLSGRVLEDGTQLARIRLDREPKMEMDTQLGVLVFLESTDVTPRLAWGVLQAMVDAVADAMQTLAPFVTWPRSEVAPRAG